MATKVSVYGGKVSTVNGIKISSKLHVIAPQGMTGKQLAAWKKRNETAIVAMVESGNYGVIESDSDDVVGDNRARGWAPQNLNHYLFICLITHFKN